MVQGVGEHEGHTGLITVDSKMVGHTGSFTPCIREEVTSRPNGVQRHCLTESNVNPRERLHDLLCRQWRSQTVPVSTYTRNSRTQLVNYGRSTGTSPTLYTGTTSRIGTETVYRRGEVFE